MKKIMFNDRYGLTQSVIDGKKTMTRRIIKGDYREVTAEGVWMDWAFNADTGDGDPKIIESQYRIGEVVAVSQRYKDIYDLLESKYGNAAANEWWCDACDELGIIPDKSPGYTNKMFVRAGLMPYCIRITDIKVERLRDISEEDCMKEGVFKYEKPPLHHENDVYAPWPPYVKAYKYDYDNLQYRCNARAAFKSLIYHIFEKGTWERNPWVFAYEFELIK